MSEFRTFKYKLSDITSLEDKSLEKIESFYDFYSEKFNVLKESCNVEDFLEWEEISSRGKFRNRFIEEYGKPYLKWDIPGNKAKYYRMMIGSYQHYILSLQEKIKISKICESHNYDISNMSNIRNELTDNNLYPTNSLIRNICRCRRIPEIERRIEPIIDFTYEDNQVSRVENLGSRVKYSLKIYDEWITFFIDIPVSNMRDFTGKFSRAIIQKDKSTNELYLRVSYEAVVHSHSFNKDLSLGIDQGKIKPIAGAITSKDGSYSTELTYSKEVEKVAEKHQVLQNEKEALYVKRSRIEALLTGLDAKSGDFFDLSISLCGVQEQIDFLRSKQSRQKEHLAWIVARDIVNHALHYNVSVIKMENLSVFQNTGKWNHSMILNQTMKVASLYNINVLVVNAKNSSHTDPFTDSHINPNNKRMMSVSIGKRDRDYIAALEISRRTGKMANKKKRRRKIKGETKTTIIAGKSRDKHAPTPKRPKQKTRKGLWKDLVKKNDNSKESNNPNDNRSGHIIAVCDLDVDSLVTQDTTASLDRGSKENCHILNNQSLL